LNNPPADSTTEQQYCWYYWFLDTFHKRSDARMRWYSSMIRAYEYIYDYYNRQYGASSSEGLTIKLPAPKVDVEKGSIELVVNAQCKDDWLEYLKLLGIKDKYGIRKATEGALLGHLKTKINSSLIVVSDDAGQFDVLRHALCWVHSERAITSINTVSYEQQEIVDNILNQFWDFFRTLHEYKNNPSDVKRKKISKNFDKLFSQKTNFELLDIALKSLLKKKSELLLVLEDPTIPLTNNISEQSIRAMVKMRKISAGTRSDDGRKSRDTFMGIRKSCKKLGISFLEYLKDRFMKENKIPQISDIILQKIALPTP